MTTHPLLLLVEDDPTSCAFLRAALRALPAVVDCAATAAQACEHARARRHDVWLIDAHLPDGDGGSLLARLRAAGATAPALAHTASTDAVILEALRAAGFDEVIVKPVGAHRLQAMVRRHLRGEEASVEAADTSTCGRDGAPPWDDAAALAVLHGNTANMAALRGLFLAELPGQREAVVHAALAGDAIALLDQLHRLRASCGFTGATRLAQAAAALSAALGCADALDRFEAAVEVTLAEADARSLGGGPA